MSHGRIPLGSRLAVSRIEPSDGLDSAADSSCNIRTARSVQRANATVGGGTSRRSAGEPNRRIPDSETTPRSRMATGEAAEAGSASDDVLAEVGGDVATERRIAARLT